MVSTSPTPPSSVDVERAVHDRYGAAANVREAALCCPIDYDPRYLEVIPQEVLERDYGCVPTSLRSDMIRWKCEGRVSSSGR